MILAGVAASDLNAEPFRMRKVHKSHATRTANLTTNAERFAAGLPPLAPRSKKDPSKTKKNKNKPSGVPIPPAGACPDGSAAWSKAFYVAAYASPYDPSSEPLGYVHIGDDPATFPNNVGYIGDKTQATPMVHNHHAHHHFILFADPSRTQFPCRSVYWFNSGGSYNQLIDGTIDNAAEMGKVDNPVTADYNGNYYQAHVWQQNDKKLTFHWQNWDQGKQTDLTIYADGGGYFYAGILTPDELTRRNYHPVQLVKVPLKKLDKI